MLNTFYFALSCIYAKKSGFKINLHTDKRGYRYLKELPYDEIWIDLEDLPNTKRCFAASKFKALENEPLGVIHIDGDVFIKKPELAHILDFEDNDLIVQSLEERGKFNYGWGWDRSAFVLSKCTYPEWTSKYLTCMFNNGVLGINNQKLKEEYLNTYWYMLDQYLEKGIDVDSVPDLIIEQGFLYDLTKARGYKVKYVLNSNRPYSSATEIGYQHLLGNAKLREFDTCKRTLFKESPEVYNYLKSAWGNEFPNLLNIF